jgi:hypothetical protein
MRTLRHILPATIALMALALMAQNVSAGITGSLHDFGSLGWAKNQICLPCHTPHNAIVRDSSGVVLRGPLWNHTLSTNVTYKLYVDPETGNEVTGQVDTNSRLCLSCHDGTVAPDSFGGLTGTQQMADRWLVGKNADLTNDHPIGDAAIWPTPNPAYLVDPALRATAGIMPLRPMSDGRLAVGCTSCHEPPNRKNQLHMLWVKNDGPATTVDGRAVSGSALCMNCHKK